MSVGHPREAARAGHNVGTKPWIRDVCKSPALTGQLKYGSYVTALGAVSDLLQLRDNLGRAKLDGAGAVEGAVFALSSRSNRSETRLRFDSPAIPRPSA